MEQRSNQHRMGTIKYLAAITALLMGTLLSSCGQKDKTYASLSDFDTWGTVYADVTGSGSASLAEKYFENAREKQYGALEDCLLAVQSGKADGLVYDENILKYYSKKDDGQLILIEEHLPTDKEIGIAFSRASKVKDLQPTMNAFLDEIRADGTLDEMFDRWVEQGNEEFPEIPVAENPTTTINAGVVGTMPPFNYYKDGMITGFDIELLSRFAYYANVKINLRVATNGGIVGDLETGTIDLASANLFMSPERKEVVDFTDPLYHSYTAVMVRNPEKETTSVSPLTWLKADFEKTILRDNRWKMILQGLATTILIAAGAVVIGTLMGFILCLLGRIQNSMLHALITCFCKLINGIPMLVTLMMFFYVILAGTGLPELVVAMIAFGVDFGVHLKGILDNGIAAVAPGEVEAAYAIGMSKRQAFRKVILPQAVQRVLPLYQGQIVALAKSTSIVGYIAIQDLTKVSDIIRSQTFEAFFPIIVTAILYFLLSNLLSWLIMAAGRRLFPSRHKA